MSAYEQIRNKLIKDKDGFSLWKKVVAGMSAGGNPPLPSEIILISSKVSDSSWRRRQTLSKLRFKWRGGGGETFYV